MPLLMIMGRPCSGKSVFAQRIAEVASGFGGKERKVVIVSDDSAAKAREQAYKDARAEKETRAAVKAAVARELTSQTLVIVDSLNYIKGFRYELFCLAKAQHTTSCCVYTEFSKGRAWNAHRRETGKDSYSDALFDELASRFEVPDATNRWDSPLFVARDETDYEPFSSDGVGGAGADDAPATVPVVSSFRPAAGLPGRGLSVPAPVGAPTSIVVDNKQPTAPPAPPTRESGEDDDDVTAACAPGSLSTPDAGSGAPTGPPIELQAAWESFPIGDVLSAVLDRKAARPSIATMPTRLSDTNYLHQLDSVTQEVTDALVLACSTASPGDSVKLPLCEVPLVLVRKPSVVECRRLRRQFLKIAKSHPPPDKQSIARVFAGYIGSNLASE